MIWLVRPSNISQSEGGQGTSHLTYFSRHRWKRRWSDNGCLSAASLRCRAVLICRAGFAGRQAIRHAARIRDICTCGGLRGLSHTVFMIMHICFNTCAWYKWAYKQEDVCEERMRLFNIIFYASPSSSLRSLTFIFSSIDDFLTRLPSESQYSQFLLPDFSLS